MERWQGKWGKVCGETRPRTTSVVCIYSDHHHHHHEVHEVLGIAQSPSPLTALHQPPSPTLCLCSRRRFFHLSDLLFPFSAACGHTHTRVCAHTYAYVCGQGERVPPLHSHMRSISSCVLGPVCVYAHMCMCVCVRVYAHVCERAFAYACMCKCVDMNATIGFACVCVRVVRACVRARGVRASLDYCVCCCY